ncbi:MAG: 23S rRNA (pseudouridine(1915)-N(3))-methyltransferase RlmH [Bdellovibrionales bacterium]|nr:23S rRNA (pseudouridine(1915)-N(3))-methyltransferase RlmH [Bdellovibrionales bacterium]
MKLYLVAFGKLKAPGIRETVDYYVRNTKAFCPIEEIELKPLPVPDKSAATRALIQAKEAELLEDRLGKILSARGSFYLLDEKGKAAVTLEWANQLRGFEERSVPEVAFCIGSSLGFSDAVKRKARGLFSLGPQTLSHEIARLVAAEQLYRALSVVRGHPYHHEG